MKSKTSFPLLGFRADSNITFEFHLHEYVYVCAYVCLFVCVCVCVCVLVYVFEFRFVCDCMRVGECARVCV